MYLDQQRYEDDALYLACYMFHCANQLCNKIIVTKRNILLALTVLIISLLFSYLKITDT